LLARRFESLDDDATTTHLVAAAVATEQVVRAPMERRRLDRKGKVGEAVSLISRSSDDCIR
jgi:hypothetical protein